MSTTEISLKAITDEIVRALNALIEPCTDGEKSSYEAALRRVPLISLPEEMRPMLQRPYESVCDALEDLEKSLNAHLAS